MLKFLKEKEMSLFTEVSFDDVLLLPQQSKIPVEKDKQIDISTFLTKQIKLKIPIISAGMPQVTEWEMAKTLASLGGIGMIHPFMKREEQIWQVQKVKSESLKVGAYIYDGWEKKELLGHIKKLIAAKVDVVCIDTYHAFNYRTLKTINLIKRTFPSLPVIAGNVATKSAVRALAKAGADAIKVGIGPGSHCTTRIVTGFGRPQLSAIAECSKTANKYKIPIIADGGIKNSGDIVKALAFGASTVMIGGLLAGCDEAPGKVVWKKGRKYKKSWGSCTRKAISNEKESLKDNLKRIAFSVKNILKNSLLEGRRENEDDSRNNFFEEGVGGLVPYKGKAETVISQLAKGVKRGLWYGGARNIKELQQKKQYVVISSLTFSENLPRLNNF